MVTPELSQFISQEYSKGRNLDEIKATLTSSHWSEADIDEAIKASDLTTIPSSQKSINFEIKKPSRHFLHILLGLFLSCLLIYIFLFMENNYFRHGLDLTQVGSVSSQASVNPSYEGKLHNSQRKSEVIELGRLVDAYKQSNGVSGPPTTDGKVVNVDDPSGPLNKPMSLIHYTFIPDPLASKYHYTYESNGASYEITCVQTDDKNENKVISLFAVMDSKQLFLDPTTRMPLAQ